MYKRALIVDLDGTITNDHHRRTLIESEGWEAYFQACDKDTPNNDVIEFMRMMHENHYHIYIFTGRSVTTRDKTIEWLRLNGVPYQTLAMRKEHTYDKNGKCPATLGAGYKEKARMVDEFGLHGTEVFAVLEDQNSMVKWWRDAGYDCWQVRPEGFLVKKEDGQ